MPQQVSTAVENNFTKGLVTEATGLNFPENAATDVDNCIFSLLGDVYRRSGIDFEENYDHTIIDRVFASISNYRWINVGGDGETQMLVLQVGDELRFYKTSAATDSSPISNQLMPQVITLSTFLASGSTRDTREQEAQYADGNGYLIVYHPYCDPFYCAYDSGTNTITANVITINIRDFTGVPEIGVAANLRPTVITQPHVYNLINQGWTAGVPWGANSTSSIQAGLGNQAFIVPAGLTATLGDSVSIYATGGLLSSLVPAGTPAMSGTLIAYSGTLMNINVTSVYSSSIVGISGNDWRLTPNNYGFITSWQAAIGNYPSNADVWWYFKNSAGAYDPNGTYLNVTLNSGFAPKGHYILKAFNQQRTLISTVPGLTDVQTTIRPRTGCWFQGRVWYTGVDDSQTATDTSGYYTWTENIYFSQTVVDTTQFGMCYQNNDPTSDRLFDLLPTDGGIITIQGCGSIYKLFPIQNGLLVFAANGIWFVTGSQGIGFAANDYTVTKISQIQSISSTSFVNVQGLPMFWNEEGIYTVTPAKEGGLTVTPMCLDTILSWYAEIPLQSKKYVRGDYNPIDYVVQWTYRDTNETDLTDRYEFNRILNYNTYNKAFYPFTIDGPPNIHGVSYVVGPGGSNTPPPQFKYITSYILENQYAFTFSDERDERYVDWYTSDNQGLDYESYFVTGYKIRGQGIKKFQPQYIQMYSRTNDAPSSYVIQSIWDYSNNRNSGRWSSQQLAVNKYLNFDVVHKRHKLRGSGFSVQFKITSVSGSPFDIIGWAVVDTTNTGT